VSPVIYGCRKIPYAAHDTLRGTMDELDEKTGVISKVSKPIAWVCSLCITEKKQRTESMLGPQRPKQGHTPPALLYSNPVVYTV